MPTGYVIREGSRRPAARGLALAAAVMFPLKGFCQPSPVGPAPAGTGDRSPTAPAASQAPPRLPGPAADTPEAPGPEATPVLTAAEYAARAGEVMEHIRRTFFQPETGLYAAAVEDRNPAFIWGSGIMFSAWAGAARYDMARHRPGMDRFFQALEVYWDHRAAVPGYEPSPAPQGGNDKYYDDNAWMVLTFLEAEALTGEVRYRERARQALEFVLSGWDEAAGGGIWWHERHNDDAKNTCVNAPAAVACFRMAAVERDPARTAHWITWGRRCADWTEKTLSAPNGLFSDHIKVSTGRIRRGQLSYN